MISTSPPGSVAISDCGQKDLSGVRIRLCGEPLELLSERRLLSAGVFRLSFSHHVHHFDAAKDRASAVQGLEPHHRANPLLDSPMILLDPIIQVAALADADRLQVPSRSVPETVCRIAGQDRLPVGLAAVDDELRRSLNQNSTVSPLLSIAR